MVKIKNVKLFKVIMNDRKCQHANFDWFVIEKKVTIFVKVCAFYFSSFYISMHSSEICRQAYKNIYITPSLPLFVNEATAEAKEVKYRL